MGTGNTARQRRVVYQWKFKRNKHDDKAINAMIERAQKIADGKAPLKKARFLKITDVTKELGQTTIDRPRQLAGLKGYDSAGIPPEGPVSAVDDRWSAAGGSTRNFRRCGEEFLCRVDPATDRLPVHGRPV